VPRRAAAAVLLVPVLALVGLGVTPAAAKERPQAQVSSEDGLLLTRFLLPEGLVTLRLPDDLAAGDTVSATLAVEAAGPSDKKRARNARRLGSMSLVLGGVRGRVEASALGPLAICGGPEGDTAIAVGCDRGGLGGPLTLPVRLETERGALVVEARVPVSPSPEEIGVGYTYLPLGLAGHPLAIRGVFDGRFDTTRVTVGGSPARPLAESPRRLVVESPAAEVGATRLRLAEGQASLGGALRNLGVYLDTSKPLLRSEERTILKVQIQGLEGIVETLPLALVSRPAGVVRFERGWKEPVLIHPSELQAGGVYSWIGTVVGVQPALFHIAVEPGEGVRPRQLELER